MLSRKCWPIVLTSTLKHLLAEIEVIVVIADIERILFTLTLSRSFRSHPSPLVHTDAKSLLQETVDAIETL